MPHLSVSTVVPTYNRASLLDRALSSALSECQPGDEIIVVDDGSTDDTEAIVRAFGPPVRYLSAPHLGAGAARNAGIRAATCDLVAFLDSDDDWVPGKLSWQRAIMERFPDILYVFSDFGGVTWSGERLHNRISSWRSNPRSWEDILGPPIPSATIPGMPGDAPRFDLHIGRLYEDYVRDWCVYTCTVVVRREQAGDALRFPEDVKTYEDVECFARLAERGLAAYMDCETAWQYGHSGTRLTDADPITCADTAITIIDRIWGADPKYLAVRDNRLELKAVVDGHRARKARALLERGSRYQARLELARCARRPWSLYLLTYAPGGLTQRSVRARRGLRSLRGGERSWGTPAGWSIVEYRGRAAFEQLEPDWKRLCNAMPLRTGFHAYETHLAYFDLLMAAPDRFRCLALSDGQRVRAICPLEARMDNVLGPSISVWGVPLHDHVLVADAICPEDDVRQAFAPTLVEFLRHEPLGGRLLALGPLPSSSVIWDGLRRLSPRMYCVHSTEPCAVFDCERPFDELMARLSKHFRRNLRSHRRKLGSLTDVRFVTATVEAGLAAEFDTFLDVEASGWKGEAGVGTAIGRHPELASFYRRLATELSGHDRGEINALYADGRCIASQFCVLSGGQYSILKIAYDEGYARIGPGLLLLEQTLERCCEDPRVKRMSLGTDGAWQRDWHPDVIAMQQVHMALGRWSGRPLISALRFRFGRGREIVRWLRSRFAAVQAERERGR